MQHNEIIYNSAALSGDPSGTMPFHAREILGALSTAVDFINHMSFMLEKSPDFINHMFSTVANNNSYINNS
ncbi:MAG: hypothetical protein LBL07_03875 [Tannerella sp.]|jgi:hypothetical protein|nr:hypothetical protein [Tannerella sp.]